jgi:thymidylate synthase (FAD)
MVKLIHRTNDAEALIGYMARVSSPKQDNPDVDKLLKYLIRNKHWSPYEMASMCVEVITSRAIAQQILRHRSFHFQEFSQRYSEVIDHEIYDARRQDEKNRQNSVDDLSPDIKDWFSLAQTEIWDKASIYYKHALSLGIAKESARFLLPLSTQTKLYMHGTLRDFIHFINLRTEQGTQREHQEIANEIKNIFIQEFPVIAKALNWNKNV